MPNWCSNDIKITGPTARIHELKKAALDGKFLASVLPEPDYTVTPVANTFPRIKAQFAKTEEERKVALANKPTIRNNSWWDWRVQNWGTKWEITISQDDIHLVELDDDRSEIAFSFDSAWSPPHGVIDALLNEEGLEIEAWWCEEGCDFGGRLKNGEVDEFTPSELKEVLTPFHAEIEERFGVISSNIEWAKEEAREKAEEPQSKVELVELENDTPGSGSMGLKITASK